MAYSKQLNKTLALMHQALICHGSHHGEGCLKNPPLQRTPRQQLTPHFRVPPGGGAMEYFKQLNKNTGAYAPGTDRPWQPPRRELPKNLPL